MPIASPSIIVANDEPDLLSRTRDSASRLSFSPRGSVRCDGPPLFRTQAARDLACLLDVDPDVEAWTCLPTALDHAAGTHVPDFAVTRSAGTVLMDAVPLDAEILPPAWVSTAAEHAGYGYERHAEVDLREGFRLDNARDLLRYASYRVTLGDRVRLLTLLEEQGPMPLAVCMQVIRDSRDAIAVIAAMALRRFVGIDLDEARIGPETRVSRFHD
jgi:hypothetical protein